MKTLFESRVRGSQAERAKPSSKLPRRRTAKPPDAGVSPNGPVARRRSGRAAAAPPSKLHLPLVGGGKPGSSSGFGCAECGLCCTYLAIEIDGPTSVKRATELLWYLYHEHVSLYVNEDSWMVQFESRCRFLTEDRRCGVYATRPHICREFSENECEINTGDDGQTFYTTAAFMAHLKQTRPRVHALVIKGFAPPDESRRGLHPFERRLHDVYARRAEATATPKPRGSTAAAKKSKSASATTETL